MSILNRMHALIISDLLLSLSNATLLRRLPMLSSHMNVTLLSFAIPYLPLINCCQNSPLPVRMLRTTIASINRTIRSTGSGVFLFAAVWPQILHLPTYSHCNSCTNAWIAPLSCQYLVDANRMDLQHFSNRDLGNFSFFHGRFDM